MVEASGVHLGSDPDVAVGGPTARVPEGSNVHLGSDPDVRVGSDPSGPDLGALATDPEIGARERAGTESDDTHFLDDAAEVEAASAVNLGEAARPTERPS